MQTLNFDGEETLAAVLENLQELLREQKAEITHDGLAGSSLRLHPLTTMLRSSKCALQASLAWLACECLRKYCDVKIP